MSYDIPDKQQAWRVVSRGHPSRALKLEEIDVPKKLGKGEILVKVQAAALNPVGWKLMSYLPNFIARRPLVPEHDLAGIVVDPHDSDFHVGDEVFGWIPTNINISTGQGALSQYTRLPAINVLRRPDNVTPVEAAGIPLAAMTALQGLTDAAKLREGQTVFINGGSSSVGLFAVYIAKAMGAKVVASASGRNEDFVRSLGVDEFVDYTQVPLYQHLTSNPPAPKFDVIFDAVGLVDPSLYKHSESYLAPGGVYVSTGPTPDFTSWGGSSGMRNMLSTVLAIARPRWLGGVKRSWKLVTVTHKEKDLARLRDLLAEGKLKPIVDSVHEFPNALQAYERIMTSRATGKVVVKIADS
ncbi:NAD(P)-binding protein [Coniophora puteana RWD-64-598 SS2]|uniref:NAD(P)-binding protein n=1 Tax=Coniophora puteana (strain RWD-64-598) TaxID=741705 RepID=A0A5M3MK66_CONPW|nr:NAD(P)-binding protein [Coniophora puteana RWD-64-598 SS2]EIW79204.1 NAD(P)-binding protein [Coniophora puteana RWD-64-598 SS2]